MNRAPLVNIPKPKKESKPLKRRKKPIDASPRHPFTSLLSIKPIKREGARGAAGRKFRKSALDHYFDKHGRITELGWTAPCQMTGREMRREDAAACHKVARGRVRMHGVEFHGDMFENIVAALWIAHDWQGLLAQATRELIASPVNVTSGGVVQWSPAIKGNLDAHLERNRR